MAFVLIALSPACAESLDRAVSEYRSQEVCQDYFPGDALQLQFPEMYPITRAWYSATLEGARGPCIRDYLRRDTAVYRFTVIPAFDSSSVVTVLCSGDRCAAWGLLVEVEYSKSIPFDGSPVYDRVIPGQEAFVTMTNEQSARFLGLVIESGVWQSPTRINGDDGEDGANWIFEGNLEGHYHLADRWRPDDGYKELFRYTAGLIGLCAGSGGCYGPLKNAA